MLLKCCRQYARKFGRFSNGHRTGKDQFSFQSQRKAGPKNVQTSVQLHSFDMLSRYGSKSFKSGFSNICTSGVQVDVQTGFRKGRRTKDQIVTMYWIIEKARELQRNIYFCFIDYIKAFDCVDHNKLENS